MHLNDEQFVKLFNAVINLRDHIVYLKCIAKTKNDDLLIERINTYLILSDKQIKVLQDFYSIQDTSTDQLANMIKDIGYISQLITYDASSLLTSKDEVVNKNELN